MDDKTLSNDTHNKQSACINKNSFVYSFHSTSDVSYVFVNCIWIFLSSSLCCVIFVFIYFHLCFFSWFFLLFVLVWQAKHCVQGNSWLHEHRIHQHVYRWVYSQDCRVWSAGKEHPHLTTATPQHICSCIKKI